MHFSCINFANFRHVGCQLSTNFVVPSASQMGLRVASKPASLSMTPDFKYRHQRGCNFPFSLLTEMSLHFGGRARHSLTIRKNYAEYGAQAYIFPPLLSDKISTSLTGIIISAVHDVSRHFRDGLPRSTGLGAVHRLVFAGGQTVGRQYSTFPRHAEQIQPMII